MLLFTLEVLAQSAAQEVHCAVLQTIICIHHVWKPFLFFAVLSENNCLAFFDNRKCGSKIKPGNGYTAENVFNNVTDIFEKKTEWEVKLSSKIQNKLSSVEMTKIKEMIAV